MTILITENEDNITLTTYIKKDVKIQTTIKTLDLKKEIKNFKNYVKLLEINKQ